MLERLWRKGKTFLHCWWECKLVQPQWKKVQMEGPHKSENRTSIQSSNSTPRYMSNRMKTLTQKDTCTPIFIATLFVILKIRSKLFH